MTDEHPPVEPDDGAAAPGSAPAGAGRAGTPPPAGGDGSGQPVDPRSRTWRRLVRPRQVRPSLRHAAEVVAQRRAARSTHPGVPTLDELLAQARAQAEVVVPEEPAADADGEESRFGRPGRAFNRDHPFYVGFVGALGVLTAYALVQLIGELSHVITLLVVAVFLALGLEPVVAALQRRGVPRAGAITLVFAGVVALVAGFVSAIVPIIVTQTTELVAEVPEYLEDVQRSQWFTDLDARYDVVGRVTEEVESFFSGDRVTALFGGVFGAGLAVVSGLFSTFTVLVLTLYFLASMHAITSTAYGLVPASRRQRVQLLGDEITRRIGGYVIGQITIATINAVASYVMMTIVGIPYALVLAVVVGVFGLIPLVGATIGAVVVVVVALFSSVTDAVIVSVYYVAYQQFENYVIVPRIMQRTVAVPGALVIVAALAGGSLLGVLGALIAIPLAAGVLLVVQEVLMPRQDRS
ncbi:AI-2E family transporter [Thalassiella azotivora]